MSQRSAMAWLGCFVCLGLSLEACIGTVDVGSGGDGGNGGQGIPAPAFDANKVDLLLVVDNSRSMADKQTILARSAAELVQSLTNPPCIDTNGNVGTTPASPLDLCPSGQTRRHAPVNDIHVGVISTSIGGHGSDSCPDVDTMMCQPDGNHTNNDKGHLLSRTDACASATSIPTYQGQGFLAWDAQQALSPPGFNDSNALEKELEALVTGVGQMGCGYESQLESMYRFLADPEPYESIPVVNFRAYPTGTDVTVLQQRKSFLRSDSLLAIVMLTDENDCSIQEFGQYYYVGQILNGSAPMHLPRSRAECAANPNDPCCKSCGENRGMCATDLTCQDPNGGSGPALLTAAEDPISLRCFDQKRRFGIDFLYPVDRYIQALTQPTVTNRAGLTVPNPIFSDLDTSDNETRVRDPGLVFFATISGVPWQEIAHNPTDLGAGFKSPAEMEQDGTWNAILGDGSTGPTNPYMIESIAPRAGVSPGNGYNGGDRTIAMHDDLQYACTFPLAVPRDCSDPNVVGCDCADPNNNDPICAVDPNNNGARTLQIAAKAYPSPRTMEVIRGIGDQGVLASICPAQTNDASRADYAYRPAVRALAERMAGRLE